MNNKTIKTDLGRSINYNVALSIHGRLDDLSCSCMINLSGI